MYVIVAGGGLFGLSLAERLIANHHEVLVIDPDPAVCAYAETEVGAMVQRGSATSTRTLEAVGIQRADIAVGMMRNDADNLAFVLLARAYGVAKRLVRMRDEDFLAPYRLAGATAIASSVKPVLDQVMTAIEYPGVDALMRIGKGNIDVFQVRVPEGARVAGMAVEAIVQSLPFPPNCSFVAVEAPGGTVEIARGTTIVPAGATVIMLAMELDLREVIRLLTAARNPNPTNAS